MHTLTIACRNKQKLSEISFLSTELNLDSYFYHIQILPLNFSSYEKQQLHMDKKLFTSFLFENLLCLFP